MAQRTERPKKPNLTPVFVFIGLGTVAILTAAFTFQKRKASEAGQASSKPAPVAEENPFADLPGIPPKSSSKSKPSGARKVLTDLAPADLEDTPLWVNAKAQAEIALALIAEAEVAKKNKEFVKYEQKANAGREVLDEQLVLTADWEMELLEKYGEADRKVDRISNQRSLWFKKVNKYRKVRDSR